MGKDRPLRDTFANVTRFVLILAAGYMTWKLQTIEGDVAKLQQDVAYLSGTMNGGRRDR